MPTQDGLLKISGQDAKKLLQGQLTCQVDGVTSTQNCLGAHCNPQGRVISLFRLFQYQGDYFLYMPRALVPIALSALKKYAVFYKTELSDVSDDLTHILSACTIEPYANIHRGITAIYPETSGKFLPHDINLPALHVVNFEKGCFTGQEIIARMEYRGKPKNHLYAATIDTEHSPKPGDLIYCKQHGTTRDVGTIADVRKEMNNHYYVLLVTDEANAIDEHLFLSSSNKTFFVMHSIRNNK